MHHVQELPALVGVGAIFIDDIVLPDGRTHMATLGGGVIHALMGASLWDEKPGLCGFAGQGLPQAVYSTLQRHFDLTGLLTLDTPQARAWQIFEYDGKRRELHRVDDIQKFVEGTQPHHLPKLYNNAKAYYLLQDFNGIKRWCEATDGLLLWEPNQLVMKPENSDRFRDVLRTQPIQIVSPNLLEAQAIYGSIGADDLIDSMLLDGAQTVALRMGELGSIVANSTERHMIPAYSDVNIIDQTGAGNTYCGGFLTGLLHGNNLLDSGCMGAVSASFCLGTVGALIANTISVTERDRRLQQLKSTII